ncbi:MAG: 4'-phosphopantetheinyl transferase superfamily protein [Acidimicrobiales bacterium]|nr:4'-phosphopantetheinyl transferase superfamily protein [Acidimicrobiales bacterium]
MRTALARTPSLAAKLFTDAERAYAEAARDPAERYAARFAAKEAALKVLGVGIGAVDWHDVEVVRTSSGAPELRVTGRASELAVDAGIRAWKVSLSHTATMAEAVVVGL